MLYATIATALGFGLLARLIKLPPLVGFLVAGFVLHGFGGEGNENLERISELGVTLLLFSIGLKLNVRQLLAPQVWAVSSLHMLLVIGVFGIGIHALAIAGFSLFASMSLPVALVLAFALSFSSTVFAVKVLEERGEGMTLHGRIAIGILIMQDLFAVVFLAIAAGKVPSLVGVGAVVGVLLLRPVIMRIMTRCGHGELLMLFGVLVALGGAQAFDSVGVKGDLGALFLGVLLSRGSNSGELAKSLLGFKDLFLIGFFLSIGLSGAPTLEIVGLALVFALAMPFKAGLFFWLLTRFRMRAGSALFTSFNLANYSEFGLIVGAIAAGNGWLPNDWLLVIAIALSFTFLIASPLNVAAHGIYRRLASRLARFERSTRLPEEAEIDPGPAVAVVFGMGRVGKGVYDSLRERLGDVVLGVDANAGVVREHEEKGRNVLHGDATDDSFWDRCSTTRKVRIAIVTMGNHEANLQAIREMTRRDERRPANLAVVGAAARYPDQARELEEAGADVALDFYENAGAGLANQVFCHVEEQGKLESLIGA